MSRAPILALAFAVFTSAALARGTLGQQPLPRFGDLAGRRPVAKPAPPEARAGIRVARILQDIRDEDFFHGVILVTRGSEVLGHEAFGLADARKRPALPIRRDALWDWASVTKQFTAAAALKLQMQGKLDLDDPLVKYLPGLKADRHDIRVRHLLNHTTGIDESCEPELGDMTRDQVLAAFDAFPKAHPAGTKFSYSNFGYFVAAALVEVVAGKPFEAYLKEALFDPAGMTETTHYGAGLDLARVPRGYRGTGPKTPYGNEMSWGFKGASGVISTVADMAKWDRALRGEAVLDAAAKKEFYAPHLGGYALGWQVERGPRETIYAHSGSVPGFASDLIRGADSGVMVAIASSMEEAPEGPEDDTEEPLPPCADPKATARRPAKQEPGTDERASPGLGEEVGQIAYELYLAATGGPPGP